MAGATPQQKEAHPITGINIGNPAYCRPNYVWVRFDGALQATTVPLTIFQQLVIQSSRPQGFQWGEFLYLSDAFLERSITQAEFDSQKPPTQYVTLNPESITLAPHDAFEFRYLEGIGWTPFVRQTIRAGTVIPYSGVLTNVPLRGRPRFDKLPFAGGKNQYLLETPSALAVDGECFGGLGSFIMSMPQPSAEGLPQIPIFTANLDIRSLSVKVSDQLIIDISCLQAKEDIEPGTPLGYTYLNQDFERIFGIEECYITKSDPSRAVPKSALSSPKAFAEYLYNKSNTLKKAQKYNKAIKHAREALATFSFIYAREEGQMIIDDRSYPLQRNIYNCLYWIGKIYRAKAKSDERHQSDLETAKRLFEIAITICNRMVETSSDDPRRQAPLVKDQNKIQKSITQLDEEIGPRQDGLAAALAQVGFDFGDAGGAGAAAAATTPPSREPM